MIVYAQDFNIVMQTIGRRTAINRLGSYILVFFWDDFAKSMLNLFVSLLSAFQFQRLSEFVIISNLILSTQEFQEIPF